MHQLQRTEGMFIQEGTMPAEATKNDERPGRHCGQMLQEVQEHDGEGRA